LSESLVFTPCAPCLPAAAAALHWAAGYCSFCCCYELLLLLLLLPQVDQLDLVQMHW
jgi:hypothetical protein